MKRQIKKFLLVDGKDKIMYFLIATTITNLVAATFKLIIGLTMPSIWFIINSLFYFVGSLARGISIRSYQKIKRGDDLKEKQRIGFHNYLINGIVLVIFGTTYFGVSYYMITNPTINDINGWLVYLVALNAFASLGISIYGMIKYKKEHSPIISAVKNTNFCNALTSIILTQVVLLDNFGENIEHGIYNGVSGIGVSVIIMVIGITMITGIKKNMKEGVTNG